MKKFIIILTLSLVCFAFVPFTFKKNQENKAIDDAIKSSLTLLQKSCSIFLNNASCVSCHSQSLGPLTFKLAKEHGFVINDSTINNSLDSTLSRWQASKKGLIEAHEMHANIEGGYALWALAANNYPDNKPIELLVHHIAGRQTAEGYWRGSSYRPPLEYSDITATALDLKAIIHYSPASQKDKTDKCITIARQWLTNQYPKTNEERIYQILGLKWSLADSEIIKKKANILISYQRPDGGWSQLDSLPSDAYATGQSLFSLNQAALLPTTSTVYQKGINFLLKTQLSDGSWLVKTRSYPVIPFVESGFPHNENQFISAAGSSWATMALILSVLAK